MVSSARLRHQTPSLFFFFLFSNHIVILILLDLIPHLLLLSLSFSLTIRSGQRRKKRANLVGLTLERTQRSPGLSLIKTS